MWKNAMLIFKDLSNIFEAIHTFLLRSFPLSTGEMQKINWMSIEHLSWLSNCGFIIYHLLPPIIPLSNNEFYSDVLSLKGHTWVNLTGLSL